MKNLLMLAALFFISFVAASCSDNPAAAESDKLSVEVAEEELQMLNKSRQPIHFLVVDRETAALINWAPGTNPETKIEPGQSKQVSFTDIYGFKQGNEVILYYWPINNGKIGEIQNLVIETE